jgi:hypothetical protein
MVYSFVQVSYSSPPKIIRANEQYLDVDLLLLVISISKVIFARIMMKGHTSAYMTDVLNR